MAYADQGLHTVQAHLADPNVRAAIIGFGNDFKASEHELRRLYSLKRIHELLQTLEYQYSLLNNDQRRLSGQELWDSIFFTEPEIEAILNDLLEAAKADSLTRQETGWTDLATQIRNDLHTAVEQVDAAKLKTTTGTLFRFLNRQPLRTNIQLVTAANSLRLSTLARAMAIVRDALNQTDQHDEAIVELNDGIAAFGDIEKRVNKLANEHDAWQQLDQELLQVEASLNQHELEEIEDAWFFLRQQTRKLYIERSEDWAVELTSLTVQLDQALAERVVVTFRRLFRRYNTLANRRFHSVDRQLLELGRRLQQVGQSLNELLGTLG